MWEKMEMEIRSLHEQGDEERAGVVDMADFNVVEERYVVSEGPHNIAVYALFARGLMNVSILHDE
jgi:hypothetical protein